MKIRKHISKMLLVGILANNFSILSNAGTLSPDTRYETFEGSSIIIPNILKEDKIDIEVEGNTLVNLTNANTYSVEQSAIDASGDTITSSNLTVYTSDRYLKATTNKEPLDSNPSWMYVNLGSINLNMLKPNTQYTVTGDIIKGISSIAIMNGNATKTLASFNRVNNNTVLLTTKNFNRDDISHQIIYGYSNWTNQPVDIEVKNIMLIEGDLTKTENLRYFKGIKSVGQDDKGGHKIEISSFNNGNLMKGTTFTNGYYVNRENGKITEHADYSYTDYIEVLPNKVIHVYNTNLNCAFYDENKNFVGKVYPVVGSNYLAGGDGAFSILAPSNAKYVKFSVPIGSQGIAKASYIKDEILNEIIRFNKKEILLNEPLRGLPNGVSDKIVKRNGQWMIERNCKEIILNGSDNEKWGKGNGTADVEGNDTVSFQRTFHDIAYGREVGINLICDKFPVYDYVTASSIGEDKEWIRHYSTTSGNIGIKILKSKLQSEDIDGFKKWLQRNPVTVVYELAEPSYELLSINPTISLYLDTTLIFSDSIVPANLKFTIDRVINRAVESIELAKIDSTMENLSRARMWINMIDDSSLKDQLQNEVNNITNIDDLQLEKKSASSNLDIYVKSQNMLSVSLNTSSVTFDDYSGVEDMEMLGAVNININSSLPYSLNAYMSSEISNSDKSETMDMEILKIKEGSNTNYQNFDNTTDKLVLKDSCNAGNNLIHNIDLKLASNQAHKADVYKTVIKFEAEQK